ncbi:MAG: hypothetical protein PWQ17_1380 [Anaerophaga sp.]|nr:hypothetical protein [Anaerophaga sp.]
MIQGRKFLKSGGQDLIILYIKEIGKWFHFFDEFRFFMGKHSYFGRLNYLASVHKVPFAVLRLPPTFCRLRNYYK